MKKNRITQTWYAGIVIVLILAPTWLPSGRASVARADKPPETASPTVMPVPPKKRRVQPATWDAHQGYTQFTSPSGNSAVSLGPLAGLATNGALVTCGASGSTDWTTNNLNPQVIRHCTLSAAQDGWAFISANGSLALQDIEYEAWFRIGIDNSTVGDEELNRWVNVYTGIPNGMDESVALSALRPISAGTHTFYFLGSRYVSGGLGTVRVRDASLSVVFIPAQDTQVVTCRGVWQPETKTYWSTTSSSFVTIHQCMLTAPQAGWAFISADGSAGLESGDYEAQFSIAIDISTTVGLDTDRYVNIYTDGGDGTDKSVALSVLKPVSAGTHTFYSLGRRSGGVGPALVYDPTLTVIFIPFPGSRVLTCGASGPSSGPPVSESFQVIHQCELTVPQDGRVFLYANGSLAQQDSLPYEAQFRIGIDDSTNGDAGTNRWVDIYNDTGIWTENAVALSVIKPVSAGLHRFYFLGRRSGGTGTVHVTDPTLSVLFVPVKSIYLPVTVKGP